MDCAVNHIRFSGRSGGLMQALPDSRSTFSTSFKISALDMSPPGFKRPPPITINLVVLFKGGWMSYAEHPSRRSTKSIPKVFSLQSILRWNCDHCHVMFLVIGWRNVWSLIFFLLRKQTIWYYWLVLLGRESDWYAIIFFPLLCSFIILIEFHHCILCQIFWSWHFLWNLFLIAVD